MNLMKAHEVEYILRTVRGQIKQFGPFWIDALLEGGKHREAATVYAGINISEDNSAIVDPDQVDETFRQKVWSIARV